MRKTLITAFLLLSSPALAEQAGCYFQNSSGDRYVLTDNHFVWHYLPAKGTDEWCGFGPDMDRGFTITCVDHGIDDTVVYHDSDATIGGAEWKKSCPAAVDLGL